MSSQRSVFGVLEQIIRSVMSFVEFFLDKYIKGLLYYQDRENNGTASAKICL